MKRAALLIAVICTLAFSAAGQRLALLQPVKEGGVPGFTKFLKAEIAKHTRVIDDDLAASAYRSVEMADPFNMSSEEARLVGSVVGSDRFLILRSALQRRASTGGTFYFEAYAVTYLVDSQTGLLLNWRLTNSEAKTEGEAIQGLFDKAAGLAAGIANHKRGPRVDDPEFPEPPPENSPDAAGLKLPVPYKRIRPEYTTTAALYSVKATVDVEVDIDAEGRIGASRIVRWAGFGLDESVEQAVRSMNWRPAMRNGKSLPMRVLLRYNFRKVEKDEEA